MSDPNGAHPDERPGGAGDDEYIEGYAKGYGDGLREALRELRSHAGRGASPQELRMLIESRLARIPERLPPIYITESGCSFADEPDAAGRIDDQDRIGYLDAHLRALADAMAAGVDVRGYLVWSLLDNFEWAEGYHQRFGLVYVDYQTQRRTPKASFGWYRDLIAGQSGNEG